MDQKAFWEQLGAHVALVSINIGEEVGLALLSGFLSKKLGTPIVLTPQTAPAPDPVSAALSTLSPSK